MTYINSRAEIGMRIRRAYRLGFFAGALFVSPTIGIMTGHIWLSIFALFLCVAMMLANYAVACRKPWP